MTPYYQDDWLTVYHGDCKTVMAEMEPESVHCVVTSPPYWGLRDYGEPGQLGLEPTPEAYVANMVAVFREVRRVLRDDGTVWLNLGDSYTSTGGHTSQGTTSQRQGRSNIAAQHEVKGVRVDGLRQKQLVGIPWRVAFALQADGWYLRSDIIWSKPNPMPESVTDRPTKSHEYIFLLSKRSRYYFDAVAVADPAASGTDLGLLRGLGAGPTDGVAWHAPSNAKRQAAGVDSRTANPEATRNIRSVWTIATAPYPGAHFATFPPKLVEPCIKAGTSEKGVCPECGAPWERVVERPQPPAEMRQAAPPDKMAYHTRAVAGGGGAIDRWYKDNPSSTTGWQPSCTHVSPLPPQPAVVLDCFAGSGTTGMVAQSLSRRAVLIDLSLDYLGQLMDRNAEIPLGLSG